MDIVRTDAATSKQNLAPPSSSPDPGPSPSPQAPTVCPVCGKDPRRSYCTVTADGKRVCCRSQEKRGQLHETEKELGLGYYHELAAPCACGLAHTGISASAAVVWKARGIAFSELLAWKQEPPAWQVRELWERGDIVVLGAPPSYGKTLLAQQATVAVALGLQVWGHFDVLRPGRVAYCDGEMSARRFRRFLGRILGGLEVDGAQFGDRALLVPGRFQLDKAEGYDEAKKELRAFKGSGGLDLLVLDTQRRFQAGDEQDSGACAAFYANLRELQEELGGPTVLVLHHLRKSYEGDRTDPLERLRGSSDIAAVADQVLVVTRKSEDGLHELEHGKSRERALPRFGVRFDGWTAGEPDPEDWQKPLRLVYQDPRQGRARDSDREALEAYLAGQPNRRATRQEALAAFEGQYGHTKLDQVRGELEALGRVTRPKVERGQPAIWELVGDAPPAPTP